MVREHLYSRNCIVTANSPTEKQVNNYHLLIIASYNQRVLLRRMKMNTSQIKSLIAMQEVISGGSMELNEN